MKLIEKNEIIMGRYKGSGWKNKDGMRVCTKEEFMQFMGYINMNSKYRSILRNTEDADEFYSACPLFKKDFPDEVKRDLFYAAKLNFKYEGIYSELVFLLKKALRTYNTPNVAISSIKWQKRMLMEGYMSEGHTIKEVIENMLGHSINLLTDYNRKAAVNEDTYEIYVENSDRVIVLPADIANMVDSAEDLRNVRYIKDVGVCVYDVPLRTMNSRLGVCFDEYDLRECV